jgi:hypothetical protein
MTEPGRLWSWGSGKPKGLSLARARGEEKKTVARQTASVQRAIRRRQRQSDARKRRARMRRLSISTLKQFKSFVSSIDWLCYLSPPSLAAGASPLSQSFLHNTLGRL